MLRRFAIPAVVLFVMLLCPNRAPAPLIFTPGEGWRYEKVGGGNWVRGRAKDQVELAIAAFEEKDYGLALKAARRTVKNWPFSDYAALGQYLLGRCYEAKGQDERAFKAYQELLTKYPRVDNYDEVVLRQFVLADKFLGGQWFRIFTYIPFFPSMDKTIKMYDQIIKNGAYSKVAPYAQIKIGAAHENKFFPDYPGAAKAYERAADRYSDRDIGTDALYQVGQAYNRQAKRAEYDQSVAGQAIASFSDFMTLHPEDKRVDEAQKLVDQLKTEQARGSFEIAKYYEKKHRLRGALIYYNEVLIKDPGSEFAESARQRIDEIKKRIQE